MTIMPNGLVNPVVKLRKLTKHNAVDKANNPGKRGKFKARSRQHG